MSKNNRQDVRNNTITLILGAVLIVMSALQLFYFVISL